MDVAIARLAAGQHGLVTRRQLGHLGLSSSAIDRRLAAGRLHAVHRGVFAVGHPLLTPRGRSLAAVLACGPGAALSHRSAAALLGFLTWDGRPHACAPRSRGPLPGVAVHRPRSLPAGELGARDGIPCTTWSRTLVDVATTLPVPRLARALEATVLAGVYDHGELLATLERSRGRPGARRLREAIALGHHLSPARTRSMLEEAFLDLVRASPELPQPRYNAWLVLDDDAAYEIDALWEGARVAVELDGRRFHDLEGARSRDRTRDAALRAHGYRVVRLTWADVTGRPRSVLRRLQREVGRIDVALRGVSGPPRAGT